MIFFILKYGTCLIKYLKSIFLFILKVVSVAWYKVSVLYKIYGVLYIFLGTRKVTQTVTEDIKVLTKLNINSVNSKKIYVIVIIFRCMIDLCTQSCQMIKITCCDTALEDTDAITRIDMLSNIFNENVSRPDNHPEFITASVSSTRILSLLFLSILNIRVFILLCWRYIFFYQLYTWHLLRFILSNFVTNLLVWPLHFFLCFFIHPHVTT